MNHFDQVSLQKLKSTWSIFAFFSLNMNITLYEFNLCWKDNFLRKFLVWQKNTMMWNSAVILPAQWFTLFEWDKHLWK